MSVALPAFIAFLILLPGFVFRSRFKRAERSSLDYSPFGQVVTEGVLWACLLHAVWLSGSHVLLGRDLRADALLNLLSSSDTASHAMAVETVAAHVSWVASYFGSLLATAFVLPTIARHAIIRFRLDRADARLSPLLRFHGAPWYYLLTGADFSEQEKPDLIAVSAVVNVSGTALLYTGILDDFFLDEQGKLDRVVLQQVMRRPLHADKAAGEPDEEANPERFYPVEGDSFVLRYTEAITLNIQYIKFDLSTGTTGPMPLNDVASGPQRDPARNSPRDSAR